jgi:zinc transporter ZupT
MEGIWTVIGLALLPAFGNLSGGLFAEFFPTPKQRLNKALHVAAGIITAVVAVELCRRPWPASFVIPVLVAAVLAYYLLRDRSETFQMGTLAFTAGLLSVAAVEDMISEAHESAEDTRWSALCFSGRLRAAHAGIGGAGKLMLSWGPLKEGMLARYPRHCLTT